MSEERKMKEEKEKEKVTKKIVIVKPANLYALKQLAQDILNAVREYEKSVKKEPKDGK